MRALVCDPYISRQVIAARKKRGHDRYDEVWNGVYVVPPMPNNEHQRIVGRFFSTLFEVVGPDAVYPSGNISDQEENWEKNYRCPDLFVILPGSLAIDRGTHWQGGPDFVVEVMSPGDDTLAKLSFYAKLRVKEVLVLERDRRIPTLYVLGRTRLQAVKPSLLENDEYLLSTVLPLAFRMVEKKDGPRLEVRRTDGRKRTWLI